MKARILTRLRLWSAAAIMLGFSTANAQGDAANGYDLFQTNCTACHQIDGEMIGPEMRNVVQRVQEQAGLGTDWLHAWIKDNKALRESGDKYANEIFAKYNNQEMLAFPGLSEADIDDILAYTSDPEGGQAAFEEAKKAAAAANAPAKGGEDSASTGVVAVGFVVLAALLFWILLRINALVKQTRDTTLEEDTLNKAVSFNEVLQKYKAVGLVGVVILTFVVMYSVFWGLMGIGVDKGYEPEQPIYFSHKVHAGIQGIDCQYCHTSAKYGKVSGIPSTNTCMNCHRTIKEYRGDYYEEELVTSGKFASADDVKAFYTGEIQKMYKAIGWNPETNKYEGNQKPIEWVRIHNMPDFVYFSHAQHVVAGEQAILKAIKEGTIPNAKELNIGSADQVCFACHGRVDEMNEVKMANDFTMGWCIECHRTTEVDMDNGYNKEYYAELHEKLKKQYGDATKITVDAIGGLECGKCHY
ncbi:c-type cytochrome [Weeksella virosa]|mgnify:CR=1 FL=1|uniref:Cytochrome c class I n=1 Tax=Weeksella virosa (strain ATCC 43766 / DSM 16922 / JCM 21250 / CCUG 30538 / CDC 9751 / IAM 14551 / NBRC 16016 / NCTC 11634 / CL345/78) TaxID=865938 RepID=F0P075_WEEVC|nr:c-type cytochrome [Weeksella virosa]ADX68435.1 cytochrome c class I [Weeksella virosa DSM 16922]MDK7375511.1 c-type cytochrome [Weeksella virosa]SUP54767.1 Cytochrome c, mono- and diheme variants [Weeksella virosa]VEH63910.1 Cytochrome c, mono- and diheme variants [Weeksella virosa]